MASEAREKAERDTLVEELRKSEEKYRGLFESLEEGFCIIDVIFDNAGKPVDWRYLETNPQFVNQGGSPDVAGQLVSVLYPQTEAYWFEFYGNVAVSGVPERMENEHKALNKWYDIFAFKIGGPESRKVGVLFRDITERKQAEEALRKAKEQTEEDRNHLETILETIPSAVVVVEASTGLFSYLNQRAMELYGVTYKGVDLEEHVARVHAFRPDGTRYPLEDMPVSHSLKFGEEVHNQEMIITRADGKRILVLVSSAPLRDVHDNITSAIVIFDDITERKRAEEVLRENEEQHAFLLKLSDAIRPLSDVVEIQETIARTAMDYFGADRCYYCEIEGDNSIIRRDASREDLPSVVGVYPLSSMPIFKDVVDSGRPFVVQDSNTTELMDENLRQLSIQRKIISCIDVPVIKDGKLVGIFCITQCTPRNWTDFEVQLAVEIAERTWAAVERARAEEALRFSEEKFRTLLNASPALIWHNDANGENISVNQHFLDFVGMTAEEIRGTGWHTLVHPDDREAYVADYLAAVREQRAWYIQNRIRRYDGEWLWFDNYAQPLFGANGKYLGHVGVSVDITERREAEVALHASEEKYRTLFESIDEGYCLIEMIYDEAGEPVDWVYLEANPTFERQIGLQAPGKTVTELIGAAEPFWLEFYARIAETGEPQRTENRVEVIDRWYTIFAARIGGADSRKVAVVFDDITERKRREQYQAFVSEISNELVGLTTIDETMSRLGEKIGHYFGVVWCMFSELTEDFEYLVSSYGWHAEGIPSLKGIFRMRDFLSDKQLTRNNAGELTIVSDTQTDSRVSSETYGALEIRSFIIVPISRDGQWRFLLSIIDNKPREWRDDEVDLLREITNRIWTRLERARVEEALKKANETLEENVKERTAELEGAYNYLKEINIVRKQEIHHRIKNNLQVISSLLDLQAEKFRGKKNIEDSKVLEAFKESQDRIISMALIHEELHKGGEIDTLNFSHYIEELTDNLLLTYKVGKNDVILDTDIEEDIFFDMDTSVPLGIIVNELVSNSLKYAFPDRDIGEIRIKLQREENTEGKIECNKSTNYVLSVSDNGVGIHENLDIEDIESLGLQLVTTLIDQLDGELELRRDNGTEFIVRFSITERNRKCTLHSE